MKLSGKDAKLYLYNRSGQLVAGPLACYIDNGETMTHPGTARDVDLAAWLDTIAFHPADTEAKQVGHEYARSVIAGIGAALHDIVPAGADKSTVYRLLGEVLMYANRALAVGGGPVGVMPENIASMRSVIEASQDIFDAVGGGDPRIAQYKAAQRGEEPAAEVTVTERPTALQRYQYTAPSGAVVRLHTLHYEAADRCSVLVTVAQAEASGIAEIELTTGAAVDELAHRLGAASDELWP